MMWEGIKNTENVGYSRQLGSLQTKNSIVCLKNKSGI